MDGGGEEELERRWRGGLTCRVSLKMPKMGDIARESKRLISLFVVTNLQEKRSRCKTLTY